jgi:hypothetical protein
MESMAPQGPVDIPACRRIEIGFGITAQGQRILTLTPIATSPDISLRAFGLLEKDARALVVHIERVLSQMDQATRPN